jgi:hypothetical protein
MFAAHHMGARKQAKLTHSQLTFNFVFLAPPFLYYIIQHTKGIALIEWPERLGSVLNDRIDADTNNILGLTFFIQDETEISTCTTMAKEEIDQESADDYDASVPRMIELKALGGGRIWNERLQELTAAGGELGPFLVL